MGSAISQNEKDRQKSLTDKAFADKMRILLLSCRPLYYVGNVTLSEGELQLISKSWKMLLDGEYSIPLAAMEDINCKSALHYFHTEFSNRIHEVYCIDRMEIPSLDKVLETLISSSIESINDPVLLKETLLDHVKDNFKRGIRTKQYGDIGNALFWALESVIEKDFNEAMKTAWTRFYSYLLSIIQPFSAEYEIKGGKEHVSIFPETPIQSLRRKFSADNLMHLVHVVSESILHDHKDDEKAAVEDLIIKSRPDYYIPNVLLVEEDIQEATRGWTLLMSGTNTDPFLERKSIQGDDFPYSSSLTWFYDCFYGKFFELCPEAKPLFANVSIVAQGKLIAGLITSLLDSVRTPVLVDDRLRNVAIKHSQQKKGVESSQFIIMGSALLWALEEVIGNPFGKRAWARIYCHLLDVMLPILIAHEHAQIPRRTRSVELLQNKLHSFRKFSSRTSIDTSESRNYHSERSKCPVGVTLSNSVSKSISMSVSNSHSKESELTSTKECSFHFNLKHHSKRSTDSATRICPVSIYEDKI